MRNELVSKYGVLVLKKFKKAKQFLEVVLLFFAAIFYKNRILFVSLCTFLSAFVILVVSYAFILFWLNHSIVPKNKTIQYYVADGSSFSVVSKGLAANHIVWGGLFFKIYGRFQNNVAHIKAGTYIFSEQDTPKSILKKLLEGDTIVVEVTVSEGLNMYQVAALLAEAYPSVSVQKWLEWMHSKNVIDFLKAKENLENVDNVEGFLFPQTYFLDPNSKPEAILKEMILEFNKNIPETMMQKAQLMHLSSVQFVTFASMIEKETENTAEQKEVAAVFWNRLKRKMRLQSDPTVIYGIWDHYSGRLSKKDLQTSNDYNTYTRYGLPLAPISNPGKKSFEAVLDPAKTTFLYFVATGTGSHIFSKDYKEHAGNVKKYLRYLRRNQK